jgi:hypothetical protein
MENITYVELHDSTLYQTLLGYANHKGEMVRACCTMGNKLYRVSVGEHEGRRQIEKSKCMWDSITVDLKRNRIGVWIGFSWLKTGAVESVHKSSDSSIFKVSDSDSSIFKTSDSDSFVKAIR